MNIVTTINQGLCGHLAERCPEGLDFRILPTMSVGQSNAHLWAPGTLTLTAETALKAGRISGSRLPARA